MTDTLDLLQAIGEDATLRHASPDELDGKLLARGASPALLAAARAGDAALLASELGQKPMKVNHDIHGPGHEEDPDQDDDDQGDGDDPKHGGHSTHPHPLRHN